MGQRQFRVVATLVEGTQGTHLWVRDFIAERTAEAFAMAAGSLVSPPPAMRGQAVVGLALMAVLEVSPHTRDLPSNTWKLLI